MSECNFPIVGGVTPDDEPAIGADAPLGILELVADFQANQTQIDSGLSLLRRPDAISFDYLVAYSFGPVAQGDISEGPIARVWRVRAQGNQVFAARANDAGSGWDADTVLFMHSGDLIVELDSAFDQNARITVVCERPTGVGETPELWVYWYDSVVADFVFQNFGPGRTPKTILDNPRDVTNSDVLIFYVSDDVDGLVYRQQRDRYLVEYVTPVVGSVDMFAEEAVITENGRVQVLFARRANGRYSLDRLVSGLYPQIPDTEQVILGYAAVSGTIVVLVLLTEAEDDIGLGYAPLSGTLGSPTIEYLTYDIEELEIGYAPISGALILPLINHSTYDREDLDLAYAPQSGILPQVVIDHSVFDREDIELGYAPQSGTLVVP